MSTKFEVATIGVTGAPAPFVRNEYKDFLQRVFNTHKYVSETEYTTSLNIKKT
jgi:hypothetical protein